MTKDAKHLFLCLLAFHMSSHELSDQIFCSFLLLFVFFNWFAGIPYLFKKYYLSYLRRHSYVLTTASCLRLPSEFSCPTCGTNDSLGNPVSFLWDSWWFLCKLFQTPGREEPSPAPTIVEGRTWLFLSWSLGQLPSDHHEGPCCHQSRSTVQMGTSEPARFTRAFYVYNPLVTSMRHLTNLLTSLLLLTSHSHTALSVPQPSSLPDLSVMPSGPLPPPPRHTHIFHSKITFLYLWYLFKIILSKSWLSFASLFIADKCFLPYSSISCLKGSIDILLIPAVLLLFLFKFI